MQGLAGTGKLLNQQSDMSITRESMVYSMTKTETGEAVASKYSVIHISPATVRIVSRRQRRLLYVTENPSGGDQLSRAW